MATKPTLATIVKVIHGYQSFGLDKQQTFNAIKAMYAYNPELRARCPKHFPEHQKNFIEL